MANTKSTKNTKGKTTSKASKTSKKKTAATKSADIPEIFETESYIKPIRREVLGILFLAFGVFFTIGLFNNDGKFIDYLMKVHKGLLGNGYWMSIPACFLAGYTLIRHHGKPVAHKVIGALMTPVLFGQLLYILCNVNTQTQNKFFETLFYQGQALEYGGVISGGLGFTLKYLLGNIGAIIVTCGLLILCLYLSLSGKFSRFFAAIAPLTKGQYREEDYVYQESVKKAAIRQNEMVLDAPSVRKSTPTVYTPPGDISLGKVDGRLELDYIDENYVPESRPSRTKVRKKTATQSASAVDSSIPFDYDDYNDTSFSQSAPIASKPVETLPAESDGFVTYPLRKPSAFKKAEPVVEKQPVIEKPPVITSASSVKNTSAFVKADEIPVIVDTPAETGNTKKKTINPKEMEKEVKAVEDAVNAASETESDYIFPPVSLLRTSTAVPGNFKDEIDKTKERLDSALKSFGISAAIVGVIRGPTVTRYDIALEQGVKLSRVTNLAGDIALSLGVVNVRIAPIPDKISTVGIEVPNKLITTVYFRDIIESPQFTTAKSKVSFAIGKDIGGNCMVGNIAKLPHMLIAGTTGSGKSVCMNSLILSLLYKATPDEVRLIMIDPKMVELGIYNSIPHLYVPVVTDPKKAAGALQWSVVEMLKRYRSFADIGVRDLEAYNKYIVSQGGKKLPQVVIVIDELADLMMIASKDVEESICRVAQMGRAAGMHLIIATQRPSADVITGLMKANIPSRIAFAVSSSLESRIILDQVGAEKLIGMGDMLYSPVGCGKPVRIQGAFVSDEEREAVIDFIKENCTGNASDNNAEILEYMNKAAEDKNSSGDSGKSAGGKSSASNDLGDEYDEMLPQAVEAVIEAKSCSVSMLQRRVKLGYSRAARIVDQMEELGIVGPYEGAKPRQVIVTREEWNQIQVKLGLIEDADMALAAQMSEESEQPDFSNFDGD